MPLQPNGAGLTEGAPVSFTPPASQSLQRIEGLGITGFGFEPTFNVPPQQVVGPRNGTIEAFVKTCQRWRLSQDQQVVLLGYKGSEFFGREFLEGRLIAPPQDVRERAGYVLAISIGLGSLFNDSENAELTWLKAPREELSGDSPLAYMLEGRMTNLMYVATMVAHERGM